MTRLSGFLGKSWFSVSLTLFLVICGTVFFSIAQAEQLDGYTIDSVQIAGNVSISSTDIFAKVRSKAKSQFSSAVAEEDAQRIAELDGVDHAYYNAKLDGGKVVLTFVVIEKNLVREISIKGNKKLNTRALITQTDIKKGDYLDVFAVSAGLEKLREYYGKKGFAFAKIDYDAQAVESGRVVYNVFEGPRVKLKAVKFVGNKGMSDKDLKRGLESKKRAWLIMPGYYSEKKARSDEGKIETAYQKRGFMNAKVIAVPEFYDNNTKVRLSFNIDEGSVYIVDDIVIKGNVALATDELFGNLKLKKDWTYSDERADFDLKKITDIYLQKGYINVRVDKKRIFVSENRIKIVFDVQEGDQFRIGKIEITGNTTTQDKVIRRVLDEDDFKPGEFYNADLARGSGDGVLEKNIKRATHAQAAFITPTGDDPNQRDAIVSITEGQTGMILFGAGVGSNDGLIGQIVYEQRNFDIFDKPDTLHDFLTGNCYKGAGQRFRVALEPGASVSRYSVSFTEPYLNDLPIQLETSISSYEREQEVYDEGRFRGYVSFSKRFDNNWYRGVALRIEDVDISDIEFSAPKEIKDAKGNNVMLGVKLFTGKSTIDNRYNPTKGYIFDVDYEQVGGDYTFGILTATNRWYKTLYEDLAERRTVLETKIHGGAIVGDAPHFEKFYAGGTGSIRGFDYRGVSTRGKSTGPGPVVRDDPIGSDWIITANAELAVPIGQGDTISALFFADSGLVDTGSVRSAIGIGIQVMIPQWFGPVPMRFELAVPVTRENGDETQVFSFSIGRLF